MPSHIGGGFRSWDPSPFNPYGYLTVAMATRQRPWLHVNLFVRHNPDGSRVPFYMCEDCKIKYIIGFTVSRTCEDCASPDIEAVFCMEMKWRRLGRLVIKRWLYFVRWKKMDRVLALYLGRLVRNPQIRSHIAGFAAQTP